jgi:HAD superfamily hydrolase (TIGR01509 family)
MIKPGKEIFHLLLNRYHLKPEQSIFIDDNINNIKAAEEIGLHAIHFKDASQLEESLSSLHLI